METLFDNFNEDPKASENVFFTANQLGSEVEMDGQGRLLFNSDLRRVVKLEGTELHLYWYRGHVEVLPDDMFKEREQSATVNAAPSLTVLRRAGLK